jgi:acetyl esterase/lipase
VVPGSGRRVAARLIAGALAVLVIAACDQSSGPDTSGTAVVGASTTTSLTAFPSTVATSTTQVISADLLEIRVPEGDGPFPAVVLAHGGGWVGGSPELMTDLAQFLTDAGFLTFNTAYTLSNGVAGFPSAIDDVACAVRTAADHPAGDGTVAVLGHSAGAHIAALVALDSGVYGRGCALTEPTIPDRLVGLAGPYDVARIGPLILPFFGVRPNENPGMWQAGNPLNQVANNPDLASLIMHGEDDSLIDLSFATDFAEALAGAGSEAVVEVVEGARHNEMHDPDVVGDLIVTWLKRD